MLSEARRKEIHAAYLREGSYAAVAKQFGINSKTVKSIVVFYAKGQDQAKASTIDSLSSNYPKTEDVKAVNPSTGLLVAKFVRLRERGLTNMECLVKLGLNFEEAEIFETKYRKGKYGTSISVLSERLVNENIDADEWLGEINEFGSIRALRAEADDLRREMESIQRRVKESKEEHLVVAKQLMASEDLNKHFQLTVNNLASETKRLKNDNEELVRQNKEVKEAVEHMKAKRTEEKARQSEETIQAVRQVLYESIQNGENFRAILYALLEILRNNPSLFPSLMYSDRQELLRTIAAGSIDYLMPSVNERMRRNQHYQEPGLNQMFDGESSPTTLQRKVDETRRNQAQIMRESGGYCTQAAYSASIPIVPDDLDLKDIFEQGRITQQKNGQPSELKSGERTENPVSRDPAVNMKSPMASAHCDATGNRCSVKPKKGKD